MRHKNWGFLVSFRNISISYPHTALAPWRSQNCIRPDTPVWQVGTFVWTNRTTSPFFKYEHAVPSHGPKGTITHPWQLSRARMYNLRLWRLTGTLNNQDDTRDPIVHRCTFISTVPLFTFTLTVHTKSGQLVNKPSAWKNVSQSSRKSQIQESRNCGFWTVKWRCTQKTLT